MAIRVDDTGHGFSPTFLLNSNPSIRLVLRKARNERFSIFLCHSVRPGRSVSEVEKPKQYVYFPKLFLSRCQRSYSRENTFTPDFGVSLERLELEECRIDSGIHIAPNM